MLTFNHSGKIGDILFSLYFCKELAEFASEEKFNFHIQTNLLENGDSIPDMNKTSSEFILPLLKSQPYINEVTYGDEVPKNSFNLQHMRKIHLNIFSGDIRSWYYNLVANHLPREFWKPVIFVEPNYKFKDKIIFSWTPRYQNLLLDYRVIEEFKDNLIFIGLPDEYDFFIKNCFKVEHLKCEDMLQIAQYIAGAGGYLGNQSGNWALADCMKVPRILASPQWLYRNNEKTLAPGPTNNIPVGGWCEYAPINDKLYYSVSELLKYIKSKGE